MVSRPKAWLLAGLILIGAAGLLVWTAPWRTGCGTGGAPQEPVGRFLEGEMVDRAMQQALDRLQGCLEEHAARPACRETPVVRLKLRAQRGQGRYGALAVAEGWLAPELLDCWRRRLEQERFDAGGQEGTMEIRYPVGCDQQGGIHIRPPAPGVSKEGRPPEMPGMVTRDPRSGNGTTGP